MIDRRYIAVVLVIAVVVVCIFVAPVRRRVVGVSARVWDAVRVHGGPTERLGGNGDIKVYVTGTTEDGYYHQRDCKIFKQAGVRRVSRPLFETQQMGLKPCPVCKPPAYKGQ